MCHLATQKGEAEGAAGLSQRRMMSCPSCALSAQLCSGASPAVATCCPGRVKFCGLSSVFA